MVDTVTIPLSWANNIPGVSGVEDATFDVPQVPDFEDVVDDVVPGLDDIGSRVDFVTLDIADIQDRLDDLRDDILAGVDDVTVDLGDVAEDIRAEVEEALTGLDLDVPGQVGELLADAEQDISGLVADIEQLDDRLVDQLPEDAGPGPLVEFESVFGALRPDIIQGFEEAINSLLDQDGAGIPDLPDIRRIVAEVQADLIAFLLQVDAPEGAEPDDVINLWLEKRGFTDDKPLLDQIIDDQIDRVTDGLVDEEVQQDLEDAVNGET